MGLQSITVVNKHHKGETPEKTERVYIGRGSPYGNPYKIGVDGSREEVIQKYRKYLKECISKNDPMIMGLLEKSRKTPLELECFCSPKKCHGDILKLALIWLDKQVD